MTLDNELAALRKTIISRNQTINGLLELNDKIVKQNAEMKDSLEKESTELKRQIKLFIDAEQWGKDTAKYEGEYK